MICTMHLQLVVLTLLATSTLAHANDGGIANALGALHVTGSRKRADAGSSNEPMVQGSLDKEVIRREMQRHSAEVRTCANVALDAGTTAHGKLTVRFVISKTGEVSESTVTSSTLENPALEKCVADVIRKATFPAPAGGGVVTVNYPYVFKAP